MAAGGTVSQCVRNKPTASGGRRFYLGITGPGWEVFPKVFHSGRLDLYGALGGKRSEKEVET